MTDFKTDDDKAKFIDKTFDLLKRIRQPYESMVDEVIKFVNFSRRKITDTDAQKGQKAGIDVYDGTAMAAATLAADGIHGYMCSSSMHWFDFTLPGKLNFSRTGGMRAWDGKRIDEYPDVKIWLDNCEEVQYSAFLRSNFYEFHPDYTREGITLGTATAVIEEDVGSGRIIFTLPHFRECYIAENSFGLVDTFYRNKKRTLRQLVHKFGADKIFKLDQNLKQQYENDPYTEKEIIHATFPRTDYDPEKLDGKNKPIASIWMLRDGQKKIIDESGYYDLPTVTWRWRKNNDEIYGRSPAWDAYIDIMKGNQQAKTNLIAGHKMVDPPMNAPEDLRGKVNNTPGGWTWIQGSVTKDKIPIPAITGIQLPYGVDQQERTDKAIKEHFHVDFFLMLYQAAFNKVDLTATQVLGMQGEQAAVLGTRIGRHQSEGLNPIMDRVFNIEVRAGRMPSPPQILQDMGGQNIEIDYLGPLSQAQRKLFKVQGIRAGLELGTAIAQVFPSSVDIVDGDATMREALESSGFPAKCLRDDDKVDEIRKIRQQQQAQQQAIEQVGDLAKGAQRLTRKVEDGSMIDMLKGGMQQGGAVQ
jgi:hypothetical protein